MENVEFTYLKFFDTNLSDTRLQELFEIDLENFVATNTIASQEILETDLENVVETNTNTFQIILNESQDK